MHYFFKAMTAALIISLSFHVTAPILTAKSTAGSGKALIQWSQVDGADGYVLYRTDSSGKNNVKVKTINQPTTLRYLDTHRKIGSTYNYAVQGFSRENGTVYYGEKSTIKTVKIKDVIKRDENNPLMLVNKENGLSSRYVPKNLVSLSTYATREMSAKKSVKTAYAKLYKGAKSAGYNIKVVSAYRSYGTQKNLFAYWSMVDGTKQALRTSAKAGKSEHQTGYALDVSCKKMGWDLKESFGSTPEGKWVAKNAHRYGFIIRYGKTKETLTGYAYEPWHIRYIGTDAAKKIYEKNITLEQFLGF